MPELTFLKSAYLQKAVAFVDSQLDLLNLKIRHPERFPTPTTQPFHSDLYLDPKSGILGIMGMTEIVESIFLLYEIKGRDGKPAPLIRMANSFERMFNFRFGDIYDKQDALFRRKPFNRTKTLDSLKAAIHREERRRNGL